MRRLRGHTTNLTSDPILRQYKFTNIYRASDRVSQYLIRNVIYDAPRSDTATVFRILLFKIFNKIETWQLLSTTTPMSDRDFDYAAAARTLNDALLGGSRIYSAAYIMPAGPTGQRKHEVHLQLLADIVRQRTISQLIASSSLSAVYQKLLSIPTLGPFLAFQYAIDLNYSAVINFHENDFVVAGPGALAGIAKCFANSAAMDPTDIIRLVADRQEEEFTSRGITFTGLCGRPLQLVDCQNIFCEIGKYARVAFPELAGNDGRNRIKQHYRATAGQINFWYPPKWNINDCIASLQVRIPEQRA